MKRIGSFISSFCIAFLFFPAPGYSQSGAADKKVIATFEEGESLVYGESSFSLTAKGTDAFFVTRKDKNYFIYEKGVRKGPYEALNEDMLIRKAPAGNPLCGKYEASDCMTDDIYNKYIKSDDHGAMVIKVKDKSWGPYIAVMQFSITCDEARFAALVMKDDQSIHLIHSSGKDLLINGTPQWLLLSPGGESALAAFGKVFDPEKIDMNNINISDFTSFKLTDLNGTIYGPYDGDKDYASNFWFCKTGGEHWYLSREGQWFRDGKPWKKEIQGYSPCDLWISEDGTRTALVDYNIETVTESKDLWLIKNPLEIFTFKEGSKTIIRWISLENEKQIVSYKRVL